MSSGADLFVVCKQCGSEVSPYITECPYCGSRLRRRAPKLPRERERERESRRPRIPIPPLGRLRRGEIAGVRAETPPYATLALVVASCVLLVLISGAYVNSGRLLVIGSLHGELVEAAAAPSSCTCSGFYAEVYAFAVLVTVGIFGSLLERRYGAPVVLVVFFGAGRDGYAGGARGLSAADRRRRQRGGSGAVGGLGDPRPGGGAGGALLRRRSDRGGGDRGGSAGDALRAAGSELAGGRRRWPGWVGAGLWADPHASRAERAYHGSRVARSHLHRRGGRRRDRGASGAGAAAPRAGGRDACGAGAAAGTGRRRCRRVAGSARRTTPRWGARRRSPMRRSARGPSRRSSRSRRGSACSSASP